MKTFYLIRHAQSESNAMQTIRPNHEIALTELGKTQAMEIATWLTNHIPTPDKVFVSSYARTHQTAQPYLDKLGLTPTVMDGLREFNYLDYEHIKDLSYPQIIKLAQNYWAKADVDYTDSPTTDSFSHLVRQVKAVRDDFAKLPEGTYVVFTHGMWLMMLAWQLMHGYQGGHCSRVFHMTKFRDFELAISPKNCEVFAYIQHNHLETIGKLKVRGND